MLTVLVIPKSEAGFTFTVALAWLLVVFRSFSFAAVFGFIVAVFVNLVLDVIACANMFIAAFAPFAKLPTVHTPVAAS